MYMGDTVTIYSARNLKILELRAQKLTYQQIADQIGITRERVRQVLQYFDANGTLTPPTICIQCNESLGYKTYRGFCRDCFDKRPQNQKKKYEWSQEYSACTICGMTDSPHSGKGKCHRCRQKERYHSDPEYREQRKQIQREYESVNSDAIRIYKQAYAKEYYKKNKKRIVERKNEWRKNNIEKHRQYSKKSYHKRKQLLNSIPMQPINKGQFEKITVQGYRGKHKELYQALDLLRVGQALKVTPEDYDSKSPLSSFVHTCEKSMNKQFKTRSIVGEPGWAILRVE